jgi:nucleoside-diphosphate-sugar epimerase
MGNRLTILVTGSNGFMGRYFKEFNELEADFVYGSTTGGQDVVRFAPLYADIDSVLRQVDIDSIIHFASVIPESFDQSSYELFLANTTMMNNLFAFSAARPIRKFIYVSSFGSMTRPDSLDVKDFYTASKISGEFFCSMLEAKGVQAAALRISAPYGEYSTRGVVNLFVQRALGHEDIMVYGTGAREQNFTYAGDVIQAIELCVVKEIGGTYSVVSEKNTSMLELAHIVLETCESRSRIVVGAVPDPQEDYRPCYSYEKAMNELGYVPKYDIRRGILRYVKWMLSK